MAIPASLCDCSRTSSSTGDGSGVGPSSGSPCATSSSCSLAWERMSRPPCCTGPASRRRRPPRQYGPEADRLEAVVGVLVSSLGEEAFDDAKARGATLSDDEAVSFASAVTRRLLADEDRVIASH